MAKIFASGTMQLLLWVQ